MTPIPPAESQSAVEPKKRDAGGTLASVLDLRSLVFVATLAAQLAVPTQAWAQEADPPKIVMPRPQSDTRVDYPEAGKGNARVILELLIDREGNVTEVQVVSGVAPFSEAAAGAARAWRFAPALRNGKVVAARVRFSVDFSEPVSEPAVDSDGDAPQADGTKPRAGAPSSGQPESETVEVTVVGFRELPERRLQRAEVRQIPGAFGDPFRSVEILPGVTPIASGFPYFFVRGAPPGNVGYFLDDIRLPVLYHAAIGPSVVHPAFIHDVKLYPGAYPARFGRYNGGIVAATAAPPAYEFRGEASVRIIDAGAMLELPFAEGKGSLMFGGRYSYTATVVSYLLPELDVSYWDYQGRLAYRLDDDDTLSLFGLGSFDFLATESDPGKLETLYDILFHRLRLRWDRVLSEKSALSTALTLGRDRTKGDGGRFEVEANNAALSLTHQHRASPRLRFESGIDGKLTRYEFLVRSQNEEGVFLFEDDENAAEYFTSRSDAQAGAYTSLTLDAGDGVTVMPGFRFDVYHSGDEILLAPEPRLRARFQVRPDVALVHGFGISHQPPSYGVPIPGIEPDMKGGLQRSFQSDAGVELALPGDMQFTATFFQNLFFNMTDDLGISRLDNEVSEEVGALLPRSFGRAVGLELHLSRSLTRDLGGYLSYTLSRSDRVLGRAEGPSTFDRRHVFNAALSYDLGSRWRAGARTTFYTGIPADVWYVRAAKHPPRTRPFYRLDWRVEKSWLIGQGDAWWALVFEVLNTTLHREELGASCYAYGCRRERIGPVVLPSVGVEAAF